MTFEVWLAFVAASIALLSIPGPVVVLLLSLTIRHGRRISSAAISGVVLGDFVAMTLSLAGVGALLAASSDLFLVMKLCGATYLVWLGISLWRSKGESISVMALADEKSAGSIFRHSFIVTALNPKDIVFFVAFLPPFINSAESVMPQLIIIEMTFLILVTISSSLWVLFSEKLRGKIRSISSTKLVNKISGGGLVGTGAFVAIFADA